MKLKYYSVYHIDDKYAIAFSKSDYNGEPVVHWLDKRYKFDNVLGVECQNTGASYYAETLTEQAPHKLSLWGDVPEWTATEEEVAVAQSYCFAEIQKNKYGFNKSEVEQAKEEFDIKSA